MVDETRKRQSAAQAAGGAAMSAAQAMKLAMRGSIALDTPQAGGSAHAYNHGSTAESALDIAAYASPPLGEARPRPIQSPAALGQLLREAREAMGLTQAAFADAAGVGRRFLSELENGKPTLELGKVMAVCAAAGVDLLAARR